MLVVELDWCNFLKLCCFRSASRCYCCRSELRLSPRKCS